MVSPRTTAKEDAAPRLRAMKRNATALLVVAAGIYLAALSAPGVGLDGFVRAGAEAAMVGGLADWFAVTALFRRPLGLPFPHTALVPRKKDELATKLGEFVTGYFLTPEALGEQVVASDVVTRVGTWLADPERSESLAVEASSLAAAALGGLDAEDVAAYLVELARRGQARRSLAPLLGRLLEGAVDGGAARPLVDVVAGQARLYLIAHRAELHPTVKRFVEERHWVAWLVTTDRLVTKLMGDVVSELEAIEARADHPLRIALDGLARSVAADLRTNPGTAARVDAQIARLLDDPAALGVVADLVGDTLESVRSSLAEPSGPLVERVATMVADLGRRVVEDGDFHDDLQRRLQAVVGYVVGRYGHELTGLIRSQVGGWPAADASRRIELAVGRDLQFIRINGTVVGALAGLAIHAASVGLTRA